jgi:hypothetical protein
LMMAGAWVKEAEFGRAIHAYHDARACAWQAGEKGVPGAANLAMQTWFSEGGAWLAAGDLKQAAGAYLGGAKQAQCVPEPMFVVEGFRMAGLCFAHAKQNDAATTHYMLAVDEAASIPPGQRAMTTLPFALQDWMRVVDAKRVQAIEASAQDYEAAVAEIVADAEARSSRLGMLPSARQIEGIESAMERRIDIAFMDCLEKRERLIAQGGESFRDVVHIGRHLLHSQWNGLPEVKHSSGKPEADIAQLLNIEAPSQESANRQAGLSA